MDETRMTSEDLLERAAELLRRELDSKFFFVEICADEFGAPYMGVSYEYYKKDGKPNIVGARVYIGHRYNEWIAGIETEESTDAIENHTVHSRRLTEKFAPVRQTVLSESEDHSFNRFVRMDIADRLSKGWIERLSSLPDGPVLDKAE